jgi:hypothetical protein
MPKQGCECESKRKRLEKTSHRRKEESGKKLRKSFGKTERWTGLVAMVPALIKWKRLQRRRKVHCGSSGVHTDCFGVELCITL